MLEKNKNIFCLVQLPPPYHGASIRNKEFIDSVKDNTKFNVTILDISGKGGIGEVGGITIKKSIFGILLLFKFLSYLFRKKFDLIYITPATSGLALLRDSIFCFISRVFKIPTACHFRAMGLSNNSTFFKRYLQIVFKKTNAIIMSDAVKYDIEEFFRDDLIHIIPNSLSNFAKITTSGYCGGPFVFLHLSNLCREKGTFDSLYAFKQIVDSGLNTEMWVAGPWFDCEEKYEFQELLKSLNLDEKVKQFGPVFNEAKWDLFREAHAFLFPTRYEKECFPGVIMEAMSAGLPCVTYGRAAIVDMVKNGKNGFWFKEGDIDGLASVMEKFCKNPQYAHRLGVNGRNSFLDCFTSQKNHNLMINLFGKLIEK